MEKPMSVDLESAITMRNLVRQHGRRSLVWMCYLWAPGIEAMARIIREGRLGRLEEVFADWLQQWGRVATAGNRGDWRMDFTQAGESGVIGDLGAHGVAVVRFLLKFFGMNIDFERVCARTSIIVKERTHADGKMYPNKAVDSFSGIATLTGDIPCYVGATRFATGWEAGFPVRFNGDCAGLGWDLALQQYITLHEKRMPVPYDVTSATAIKGWTSPGSHLEGTKHILVSGADGDGGYVPGLPTDYAWYFARGMRRYVEWNYPRGRRASQFCPYSDFDDSLRTELVCDGYFQSGVEGVWKDIDWDSIKYDGRQLNRRAA
jgi:predicted dehydrogenase